jgi:iron complex transport system ATP-binding protein
VPVTAHPVLTLRDVTVVRESTTLLSSVSWQVRRDEHWVIFGPNGAGKTTLLRVACMALHPSRGEVEVLGERLGRTDVRALRSRIGITSAAVSAQLRPGLTAEEVVVTGRYGALEPWWHPYSDADHDRAGALLQTVGCGRLATHSFGTLSSGERQRVLLARTLMPAPELLLLDEPMAGLDLGGREDLIATLTELAGDPAGPPIVLVTHHVDELPPGFTHVLLLRDGSVATSGPLETTLTSASLSACFDRPLELVHDSGRWSARLDQSL